MDIINSFCQVWMREYYSCLPLGMFQLAAGKFVPISSIRGSALAPVAAGIPFKKQPHKGKV